MKKFTQTLSDRKSSGILQTLNHFLRHKRDDKSLNVNSLIKLDRYACLCARRFRTGSIVLIEDFAALGVLNEAAVSGLRQAPHDQVAQLARGGTAGLYRLIAGRPEFKAARWASWLSKPRPTSYSEFYDELRPWPERPETTLWQRQLTLGPTSEFCLQSRENVELPEQFASTAVALTPLWSEMISR